MAGETFLYFVSNSFASGLTRILNFSFSFVKLYTPFRKITWASCGSTFLEWHLVLRARRLLSLRKAPFRLSTKEVEMVLQRSLLSKISRISNSSPNTMRVDILVILPFLRSLTTCAYFNDWSATFIGNGLRPRPL